MYRIFILAVTFLESFTELHGAEMHKVPLEHFQLRRNQFPSADSFTVLDKARDEVVPMRPDDGDVVLHKIVQQIVPIMMGDNSRNGKPIADTNNDDVMVYSGNIQILPESEVEPRMMTGEIPSPHLSKGQDQEPFKILDNSDVVLHKQLKDENNRKMKNVDINSPEIMEREGSSEEDSDKSSDESSDNRKKMYFGIKRRPEFMKRGRSSEEYSDQSSYDYSEENDDNDITVIVMQKKGEQKICSLTVSKPFKLKHFKCKHISGKITNFSGGI